MSIPGSANPLLLAAAAEAVAGYQVERSLRFEQEADVSLRRTPSSGGNRQVFTWSGWVKRSISSNSDDRYLFVCRVDGNDSSGFWFNGNTDSIYIVDENGGTLRTNLQTTRVFRDYSAWYHIVVAVDTTQATASERVRLYVNGERVTDFSTATYPSQNDEWYINSTTLHKIGEENGSAKTFDGYMAEINFIDGQSLDADSFGVSDSNGVWQPKDTSSLTFGTNGFRLAFSDNTSTTTLGTDTSGNGNDWSTVNFSVTAGVNNDSLFDSPTNGTQTDTGVGGEVSGNYAVLNPISIAPIGSFPAATNGGLVCNDSIQNTGTKYASTIGITTGKWYFEVKMTGPFSGKTSIGISEIEWASTDLGSNNSGMASASYPDSWGIYLEGTNFDVFNNGNEKQSGTKSNGDIAGFAVDLDGGNLTIYKNGTQEYTTSSLTTGITYWPSVQFGKGSSAGNTNTEWNFGQRAFAYTAPSGYKAICSTNLSDPAVANGSKGMSTKIYTGTGSTQSITGFDFSPDFVWLKKIATGNEHRLFDTVRGATLYVKSNNSNAEATDVNSLTSFNSDGFSLGNETITNENGAEHLAYCWDAGTSTVSNTDGTITASVRASQTYGFSIITYTGNDSASQTIGHGLGAVPKVVFTKNTSSASTNWTVDNKIFGTDQTLRLNDNSTSVASANALTWTTTTVNVDGTNNTLNEEYVVYAWTDIEGFSSFGSYEGIGNDDGPWIHTGFRPQYVVVKTNDTSGGNWCANVSAQTPYNLGTDYIALNQTANALVNGGIDILSNGFKFRDQLAPYNQASTNYFYMAFAEHPFKYARAR